MTHVAQKPRTGREKMPRPLTPKMKPASNQAPVARVGGQDLVHADPTVVDVAAPAGMNDARFSNQGGMPDAKPGARKAAAAAAGKRPARPLTPKLKAMAFGPGPSNPFR
jgi:hypothetical protein